MILALTIALIRTVAPTEWSQVWPAWLIAAGMDYILFLNLIVGFQSKEPRK